VTPAAVTVPGSVTAGLEPGVCRDRVADTLARARQARGLTQQQAAGHWTGRCPS
jgi:hypothetical protein